MDRVWVDHLHLLAEIHLGGQRQYLRDEGGISFSVVFEYPPKPTSERWGELYLATVLMVRNALDEKLHSQALAGLPAIEGVAIEAQQSPQRFVGVVVVDDDRCGEVPTERRHRLCRHAHETKHFARLPQGQHPATTLRVRFTIQLQGDLLPLRIEQADGEWKVERELLGLAGRRRAAL